MKTLIRTTARRAAQAAVLPVLAGVLAGVAPAHAQPSFGNALAFDGTNQYVAVPGAVWLTNQFTVESWVQVRSHHAWARLMDFGQGPGVNAVYCALSQSTSGRPTFGGYNGTNTEMGFVTAPAPLPLNSWVHLAFTCDGTTGRIYTNGLLAASGPMTGPANAVRTNNFIGRSNWPDPYANAIVDEFRLWNTARSPAQIQAHLGAPLTGSEPNLLLYYRFDSSNGTVATNSATATGPAYDGTLVNAPAWAAAGVLLVTNNADSGPGSLRQTVAQASSGAVITFAPPLSGAAITLTNGQIILDRNLTIDGSSLPNGIQIQGHGAARVFHVNMGVTVKLNALTIAHGNASGDLGGGIYNLGALTVSRCTLTANSAQGGAGIASVGAAARLLLHSCTIASNTAVYAGGLLSRDGESILTHSTVAGNTGTGGSGGLVLENGMVILDTTIVAGNAGTVAPDLGGAGSQLALLGRNLVGNNSGNYAFLVPACPAVFCNQIAGDGGFPVDPRLSPLGAYGGPTRTMPPLGDSPALDTAASGLSSTAFPTLIDQRGFQRTVGPGMDIGAVEYQVQPVVTTTNDSGAGSLRSALAYALPGSSVSFAPGLAGATIALRSSELLVGTAVTVDASALPGGLTVTGGQMTNLGPILRVTGSGDATLVNLTLTGSRYSAILNEGRLTVSRCALVNNNGENGGGVYNSGTLWVNDSTISGNLVGNLGGGILNSGGTMTLSRCVLSGNNADYGGGIYNTGNAFATDSTMANNLARGVGWAGGIYNLSANMTLNNCVISSNRAPSGGGIRNVGTMRVTNCTLVGNSTYAGTGGGIRNQGTMTVSGSTIRGNSTSAAHGGGVHHESGTLTLFRSVVAENAASGQEGGGIYSAATLEMDQCDITGNTAAYGAGLSARGTGGVTLWRSTFSRNQAIGSFNGGGGLYVGTDPVTVNQCTFHDNAASYYGGGIYSGFGGGLLLDQCTLARNSALLGGALLVSQVSAFVGSDTTLLNHCTISGNSADTLGGGLYLVAQPGTVTISNSVIAGNSLTNAGSGADLWSEFVYTRAGANIIPLASGPSSGPAAITSPPALAPLADYGGPTRSMPPLPGSPAIDAAVDSKGATDQRGLPRRVDGDGNGSAVADIGAVESSIVRVTTAADELDPVGVPGTGRSLREALRDAGVGTLLDFAGPLSGQTIALNSQLVVDKPVFIGAQSLPGGLTVDGGSRGFRLFTVASGASLALKDLTLTGGGGPGFFGSGGAISNGGSLTLESCALVNNAASQFGGAVYGQGPVVMSQCTLAGNSSELGGGAVYGASTLELTHCTLSGNATETDGGGILSYGPLTLSYSIVAGNRKLSGAGADIFNAGSVAFRGANVVQSQAGGGSVTGLGAINSPPNLVPLANYGGRTPTMPLLPDSPALNAATGSPALTDQRGFPRPVGAAPDLGAFEATVAIVTSAATSGPGTLRDRIANAAPGSVIGIGTFPAGTRLAVDREIAIDRSLVIAGNNQSGGVRTVAGTGGTNRILSVNPGVSVTLAGLNLTNGHGGGSAPSGSGGAILNRGTLTLVRCTVSGSSAVRGGGIHNEVGVLELQNSTLALNSASYLGGGLQNNDGRVTLVQSTISSNTAPAGGGGGVVNSGGGAAAATARGTILSGNRGGDVNVSSNALPASFISAGHNLVGGGNAFGVFTAAGDQTNVLDPRLLRLADYGGNLPTMHPANGSPVVDGGESIDPGGTDARGLARLVYQAVDIGAVEAFFGPTLGLFFVDKLIDLGPPITDKVEISYDLIDPEVAALNVTLEYSRDGGLTWATAASSTGAVGSGVPAGSGKRITWNALGDLGEVLAPQVFVRLTATEPPGSVSGRAPQAVTRTSQRLILDTRPRFVTVKGRVVNELGYPLSGVRIGIVTNGVEMPPVWTDVRGQYAVPNVMRAGGLLGASTNTYSPQSRVISTIAGIREHVMEDIQLVRLAFQVSGLARNVGGIYLGGSFDFNERFTVNIDWGQRTPARVDWLLDGTLVKRVSNPSGTRAVVDLNMAQLGSGFLPYSRKQLRVVAVGSDGEESRAATTDLEFVGLDWLQAARMQVQQVGGWNVEPRYTVSGSWPPDPFPNPFPDLAIFGKPGLDLSVNLGLVYAPRSGDWQLWLGDPGFAGVRSDWRPAGIEKDAAGLDIAFKNLNITMKAFAQGHASSRGFGFNQGLAEASLRYNQRLGELCLSDALEPFVPGSKRVLSRINDVCEDLGYDFNSLQCIRFDLDLTGTLRVGVNKDSGSLKFAGGSFTAGGELSAYYRPDLGGWIVLYGRIAGGVEITFAVPSFAFCNTRFYALVEAGAYLDWGALGKSGFEGRWMLVDRTFGVQCGPSFAPAAGDGPQVLQALPVVNKRILGGLPAPPPGEVFVANEPPAPAPLPAGAGFLPASDPPGQTSQVLVQNVHERSAHAMAARGSELTVVYTRSNSPTSMELLWTRYNGSVWSVPAPVPGSASSLILDPVVAYDGPGNVIVAWQQMTAALPLPETNLTTITASLEVKSAQMTNGVWNPAQSITANGVYDGEPRLCGLPGGDVLLLWRQQQPGTNFSVGGQLLSRRWTAGTRAWAAQTTVDSGFLGNSDLACASGANKLVLAWKVDPDGVSSNSFDTEIYYRIWTNNAWLAPVRFTTDAVPDQTPRVAITPGGNTYLAWLKGQQLVFSTNFNPPVVVRDNVNLLGMSDLQLTVRDTRDALLLWSEAYDHGSDGFFAVYDAAAGLWGEVSPLWQDRDVERDIHLAWDPSGNLLTTYMKERLTNTVQELTALDTNDIPVVVIASNVSERVSTDLAFTRKPLLANLSIAAGDFTVAEESFLPGNTILLTAKLSNTGDLAVTNAGLRFSFIPDNGAPTVLISQGVASGWLRARTNGVFTATWVVPPGLPRGRVVATADPANLVTEFDESAADNTQSIERGGADLIVALKNKTCYPNGTARVIASVFNAGSTSSPAATLELTRGNGSLVTNAPVAAIDPGDAYDVAFVLENYQSIVFDTYTLRIDPASVNDADGSNNLSRFSVSLPVLPLADATTTEDTPVTVPAPVGDATYNVTFDSSNPALVPDTHLQRNGSGPEQTLTLTPLPDQSGSTVITMTVADASATNIVSFTLTVLPVNDAPGFLKGPDRQALVNGGPQAANGWATGLSAGPADEDGQSFLGFLVSNNNNSLFSTPPAIDGNGRLTFTPALNQAGVATVSVRLQDNGGTSHGGVDTSAPQTFTITVVNGAPSNGRSIVWVSDFLTNATLNRLPDQDLVDLLVLNGYNVTRFNPPDAGAIPATNVALLNAADLVILGRSLNSAAFDTPAEAGPWNTAVTRPILSVNGYLSRANRLGWFQGNTIPDGLVSPLNFNDPANPVSAFILAGTPLTNGTTTNAVFQPIPLPAGGIDRGMSVNTDAPVPGATNLATTLAPANGQFLVAWPAGTALTGNAAGQTLAGYRMQFPAGNREAAAAPDNTVNSAGFNNLTVLGETLFLRAVRMAVSMGTTPSSSVVLNTNDAGPGSLRDVVAEAPATTNHTITFAPQLSGQTILLTSGQVPLDKNLAIDASSLPAGVTISGGNASRIFLVSPGVTSTLTRLTLTRGLGVNGPPGVRAYGGAILNEGVIHLAGCVLSASSGFAGGALYNRGSSGGRVTLNACSFTGNTAQYGGAIQNEGVLVASNSTFAGNSSGIHAGAVNAAFGQPVTLEHCTLSGNSSAEGGALRASGGGVTVRHCIIAGNSAPSGPDIFGPFTSLGNNLTHGAPLLAPLGPYGGPTPTMPPLTGSPALDAGDPAFNGTGLFDQRGPGYPRVVNGRLDLGAVEGAYQPTVQFTSTGRLPNGVFHAGFTGDTGIPFVVRASTRVTQPLSNWFTLGAPLEGPAGQYQFTDANATNLPQRFYAVTPGYPTTFRWATHVLNFSSQYDPVAWSAAQALEAPDTYPSHGDIETAWASLTEDGQPEFIELGFDTLPSVNAVSVYETYNPGAVNRILVRNADTGQWVQVWSGPASPAPLVARIFTATFAPTGFPVDAVRLDLDSPAVPGWNEIDAVAIHGPLP